MSLRLLPDARSITDTVPGPSFDTSPVRLSGRIAAPYGYGPVATYRTACVRVSMIAAWSARLSGTSSVLPSPETASLSGHAIFVNDVGGKFCGIGADDGGGTPIVPVSEARPVRALYRNTWITSPPRPGRPGRFSSALVESLTPETYASPRLPSIAIPPDAPGTGSTCMTLGRLRPIATMRTSFNARPVETVQ